MMRRLFLTDVHAVLPAFEAVLRDAGEVDEILFLGDIIGYGPHPAQCVDLLARLGSLNIIGNHDEELLSLSPDAVVPEHSPHHQWLHWTFRQLTPSQRAYLAGLPARLSPQGGQTAVLAVHRLSGPYLHPRMSDAMLQIVLAEVAEPLVLCGHSHWPIDRTVQGKRLICIPSAGQPRNHDPRAGYAIEDDGHIQFRYVPYDLEPVVADIRKIGLPSFFTERWIRFLRSGYDAEWSRDWDDESD
ncbi:MAG: metallophosphoesterase family protein [Armatimonadota bacterium]